jgi:hypothetical protein
MGITPPGILKEDRELAMGDRTEDHRDAGHVLWRRIDPPGHDACRLARLEAGHLLEGVAAFAAERGPAAFAYRILCGSDWRAESGEVRGWIGGRELAFAVRRGTDGAWSLDGRAVPGLETCVDLDLGFTPSTNLTQMRRAALAVGQAADVPVAWLDVETGALDLLEQRYERRTETAYWYEAPRFGYRALLEVDAHGFVRRYPGLWDAEPPLPPSEG